MTLLVSVDGGTCVGFGWCFNVVRLIVVSSQLARSYVGGKEYI